jgi:hypothetical protein
MIVAALLLQATAVPGLPESLVIPGPAPRLRHNTPPGVAIDTFRDICLPYLRDRAALARAAQQSDLRIEPTPGSGTGSDTFRRGDLTLHYNAAGSLQSDRNQPQCIVEAWLDGAIGEGAFERRFVAKVKPGERVQARPVRMWERPDGATIGLQTRLLSHGQISATLFAAAGPGAPH